MSLRQWQWVDPSFSGLGVRAAVGAAGFGHGYAQGETLHDTQEKSILSKVYVLLFYHTEFSLQRTLDFKLTVKYNLPREA